jgi:hypothetical protein
MSDLSDSTWAVDLEGTDQDLEGTDWQLLIPEQVLWDLNETFGSPDYDIDNSQFDVQVSGIYLHDTQLKFKDLVNVKSIDVGVFQVVDEVSSFWYRMGFTEVPLGAGEIQMNNAEQLNFLQDEIYQLKVKLTPVDGLLPCSATLDGSEDFTAWSASWLKVNVLG